MKNIFTKLVKVVYADPPGKEPVESTNLPSYDGTGFNFAYKNTNDVIGSLLPYIYVVAGLILLLMLISGGITLMTSGGSPEKSKAGYGRITGALIGFLIIFISYFVAKIVEVVLGVKFM
ncbi:MAG: hypothetical protein PHH12_03045 [Candidatus Shapirobacteria bacterium]|jgi:hypothetical protein|nr:hypothetical protein [Candidatus Shapirobacteria bacterium]